MSNIHLKRGQTHFWKQREEQYLFWRTKEIMILKFYKGVMIVQGNKILRIFLDSWLFDETRNSFDLGGLISPHILFVFFFFSFIKNLLLLIYTSLSDKKDLKRLSLSRCIISWHYTRVDNRTKLGQDEDKYLFHLFCFKNIYTLSLSHTLSWSSWCSFQIVWPRVGAQRIHFDKWYFPHGQKEVRLNQDFEST